MEIQWQPGITPDTDRLDKNGGPGSPRRFLVTFVRTKVTRGAGPGRPREPSPEAARFGRPRGLGPGRPESLQG